MGAEAVPPMLAREATPQVNISSLKTFAARTIRMPWIARITKPAREMKSINLVDVLIAATKIFKASINRSVQIKTMINCEDAKIKGDSISLEQMLLNLFINASHAMTIMRGDDKSLWGGTLTITLDYKKADVVSEFGIQTDGGYVLSVADTGVGMSDEIKQKIFNPFFSTKNKGNGTGLGLLMVQNIVNGHGGFLKVISQPGIGSEFKIYLPIDEEKSK